MKINFLIAFLSIVALFSCKNENEEIDPNCESPIGNELIAYRYYNDGTPTLSESPINIRGNIQYEEAFAIDVNNGVDIVIPGVRIRTATDNFEITRFKVDEKRTTDNCFIFQDEFSNDRSSFQTDIASVLVLDMSTSLINNIDQLKSYAKNFANTVVNSSSNSQVAVVFFLIEMQ